MGTGWRISDSEGGEHKSWQSAARACLRSPQLTFTESWVSMAGTNERDATEDVRRRAYTFGKVAGPDQ